MFCASKAVGKCLTVRGITVAYRQWKDLPYVSNPRAPQLQVLNLYVPENSGEGKWTISCPGAFPTAAIMIWNICFPGWTKSVNKSQNRPENRGG